MACCGTTAKRLARHAISVLLFFCSLAWIAGQWAFLIAAVSSPVGHLSVRCDNTGWILQQMPRQAEPTNFKVVWGQQNRMTWSEITSDANYRTVVPGVLWASWTKGTTVNVRVLGIRHWLVVLILTLMVVAMLRNCRDRKPMNHLDTVG